MKRCLTYAMGLVLAIGTARGDDEVQWRPAALVPAVPLPTATTPNDSIRLTAAREPFVTLSGATLTPRRHVPSISGPIVWQASSQPVPEPLPTPRPLNSTPPQTEVKPTEPAPVIVAEPMMTWGPAEYAFTNDPRQRTWAKAEALLWFRRLMDAPPLVTTATPPDVGIIGEPTTRILYGNGPIGNPFHVGGRFSVGRWLDCDYTCAAEAVFFFLGPNYERFHADNSQFPVIARPFFRANLPDPNPAPPPPGPPPGQDAESVVRPGVVTGGIDIENSTFLMGAEANARECLCCGCSRWGNYRIDLFGGFRYLYLHDRLFIQENLQVLVDIPNVVPPVQAGTTVQVNDLFETHNHFFGGQLGMVAELRRGRKFVESRVSVAMGYNHRTILIDGSQLITPPMGAPMTEVGGLLALPSNIGRHTSGSFAVATEATVNGGFMLTPRFRVFGGYNFLFWSSVFRAAEQIDLTLDVNQVPRFVPPGTFLDVVPPRPRVPFNASGFWAQGLQFGAELRW